MHNGLVVVVVVVVVVMTHYLMFQLSDLVILYILSSFSLHILAFRGHLVTLCACVCVCVYVCMCVHVCVHTQYTCTQTNMTSMFYATFFVVELIHENVTTKKTIKTKIIID